MTFDSMRTFETGATRDVDVEKFDYEGFFSPEVLERFAAYMHKNRIQRDGTRRDGDNWQKGIPKTVYMKSMWRHFVDVWKAHRGLPAPDIEEGLTALMFNVMGYLFEVLKEKKERNDRTSSVSRPSPSSWLAAEVIPCLDTSPNGTSYCTLKRGHDGKHE